MTDTVKAYAVCVAAHTVPFVTVIAVAAVMVA